MDQELLALKICMKLQSKGFAAVFAGGCVRDKLLQIQPNDFDIATSATPDQVENLFDKTIAVGKRFGVIVVREDGMECEVATFRSDGNYSDGRRPDSVEFSSMEEDAKRRDFTINGMFFNPVSGEVFDFVGGRDDIEDGIIRFIGNAEDRIKEDKLRMLRAIRFAVRFDFKFDFRSMAAIINNASLIVQVSQERVKSELDKMLLLEKPSIAIETLKGFGLLKVILPDVNDMWNCEQSPKWHSEGNVGIHTMMVLDATRKKTDNIATLWAALLHDVAKPLTAFEKEDGTISNHGHDKLGAKIAELILSKTFKASNDETEAVSFMINNHMKTNSVKKMKKSTLKKFVANKHFNDLINLLEADCESSIPADKNKADHKLDGVLFLREFISNEENIKVLPVPFVNGKDLIDFGVNPGKIFRQLLDEAFNLQLEEEISSREDALIKLRMAVIEISR